jgi:hypothetical protein
MNLGYESGDQVGAFDEKKQMSKISCKCTFKPKICGLSISVGHLLQINYSGKPIS